MRKVWVVGSLLLVALSACVHQRAAEPPAAAVTAPPQATPVPPQPEPAAAPQVSAPVTAPAPPVSGASPTLKPGTSAATPAPRAAAATPAQKPPPALEQRLRDTRAIGVFTKLSIKNQVDDLLAAFKGFHGGKPKPTLADLRQKYELLLLKVVSVLQDGDAQLASAVSASREAIWAVLADPQKFSQISVS
jgi:hypothetical protein